MVATSIPLSSKFAAWLVTLSQFAGLAGTYFLTSDNLPFGWNAYNVGLALIVAGQLATFAVTALRKNLVPLISSGTGLEP